MRQPTEKEKELIKEWADAQAVATALWKKVVQAGLYYHCLGVDINRPDSAWRPPSSTEQSEKEFFAGVVHSPRGRGSSGGDYRYSKKEVKLVVNLDDLD